MTKFNNILVSGCSLAAGGALPQGINDPQLWVNIVAEQLDAKCHNVSTNGASNQIIFEEALTGLTNIPNIDLLIVAWTVFPRFRFYPGIESFNPEYFNITPSAKLDTYQHDWKGGSISKTQMADLAKILLTMDEDVHNFVQILRYTATISHVVKLMNIPVVFVNAAIPNWTKEFFVRKDLTAIGGPNNLDHLSKKLINVEDRDDSDIAVIYNRLHARIEKMGDINLDKWLNFDTSFYSMGIDKAIDNSHLGVKSNKLYAKLMLQYLHDL